MKAYFNYTKNNRFKTFTNLGLNIAVLLMLLLGCSSGTEKGEITLYLVDQNGDALPNIELEIQNERKRADEMGKIFYDLELKGKKQLVKIKLSEGTSLAAFAFIDPEEVEFRKEDHMEYVITLFRRRQITFDTYIYDQGKQTPLNGVEISPQDENIYLETEEENLTDSNGRLIGYIDPETLDKLEFTAKHGDKKLTKNLNFARNKFNYNLDFVFNQRTVTPAAPRGFGRLAIFSKSRDIPFRIIGGSSSVGSGFVRPRIPVSQRTIEVQPEGKSVIKVPLELQVGYSDSVIVDFNNNRFDLWRKKIGENKYQRIKRNVSF
jgi:hypothetical protein